MTTSRGLNFVRPAAPGGGAKFLAPPYYSQRTGFASPPSTFSLSLLPLKFEVTEKILIRLTFTVQLR